MITRPFGAPQSDPEISTDPSAQARPLPRREVAPVIKVLVVDDHIPSLMQLQKGLLALEQGYEVVLAENGQEAIGVLEQTEIDLVVTDLNMPFADGFGLLTYIKRTQSNLPVVVVTGMAPLDYTDRLDPFGSVTVMSKPVEAQKLTAEIDRLLAEKSSGNLQGVTLPGFLQLIEMERKSCSVRVSKGDLKGRLHFLSGDLVSAYTFDDDREGLSAARRILSWGDVDIEIERSYHNHKRLIDKSLQEILMEVAVAADEAGPETADESAPAAEMPASVFGALTDAQASDRAWDEHSLPSVMEDPSPVMAAERTLQMLPEMHALNGVDKRTTHTQNAAGEWIENALEADGREAWWAPPTQVAETPEEIDIDRELRDALQRLSDRARQLDEAVAGLLGEVGSFMDTRQRIRQLELQELERRRELEKVRQGADSFAHKMLTAAVQALEETLG